MAKIALLGIGVVGSGTAELLQSNAQNISAAAREEIEIKYILAAREHPESPFRDRIIHDFSLIERDPEISVVAECIGGAGVAFDYVSRALRAGKSVVTSNKELIAEKGLELLALAKQRRVSLLFEASVGGGIPIIRPLAQCLAANRIDEVYGILNGTTNYILTQMLQCGKDFEAALREAQALGYAEADPSADVDGIDACRKISILADMCFGRNVCPADVATEGIRSITARDACFAEALGCSIKLLGRAVRHEEGACVYVAPHLIAKNALLSNVSGVMNGIVVRANAVGECFFYGPGAGKLPTASAMVADIIDAVLHEADRKYIDWGAHAALTPAEELPGRWYVRLRADERTRALAAGLPCAEKEGELAFLSREMPRRELDGLLSGFDTARVLRVLD